MECSEKLKIEKSGKTVAAIRNVSITCKKCQTTTYYIPKRIITIVPRKRKLL